MVIDASDIDFVHMLLEDNCIITKEATIGSPIHKGTAILLGRMSIGDSIVTRVCLNRHSVISSSGGHYRSGLIVCPAVSSNGLYCGKGR